MKISCVEIERHDHSCVLFDTDDEFVGYTVAMIRRGLYAHDQCIVITDEISEDDIKKHLSLLSISSADLIQKEQLIFARFQDFYIPNGDFRISEMTQTISKTVRKAFQKNFAGLRGIAEVGPSLRRVPFNDFVQYEIEVQDLFFRYPISALCAYRRSLLSES